MENITNTIEMKTIPKRRYDQDDLMQECNAFMKTKVFMAKRIAEQQNEIDLLVSELYCQAVKQTELYNALRALNDKIDLIKLENTKKDEQHLDISGDYVSSVVLEDEKEAAIQCMCPIYEKDIQGLKNENLELRKEIELVRYENSVKTIDNSRLFYEKYILFSELNELVTCLKRIDLKSLNEFFIKNEIH
jgi:hypothetical protein